MREIVKYHNDINKVNLSSYSEKELNLFFSLIFLSKEKGETKLIIPFSELKELADGDKNRERFIKNLINVNKKLIKLNHQIEVDNVIHIFTLFNTFSIDKDNNTLTVEINKIFSYMLSNLIGNFTKFDLLEFVSLKSSYSKNLFKLLKQWESVKSKEFSIDEIRKLLGVPNSYTSTNFNERVLKPIMEELPKYFSNLKIEKIKTGRKVTSIKFTWESKKEIIDLNENEVIEIKISKELNKAIEKAKKNRYIEKFLNVDNIELLLEMFEENDLIKGLIWAYKEVKQEITSLNYLVKTIKTGTNKKEKKLVVVQEEQKKNIFEETFEEIPLNFEEKKEKITREEYEDLYKNYLKENGITHSKPVKIAFDNFVKGKYEIIEKKLYTEKDIDEKLLVSKSGKKLVGSARKYKIEKILKELNSI